MDTWTLQTGFPIVTVIRNYPDKSAHLSQQRFLLLGNDNNTNEQYWWIPITYTTQQKPDFNNTNTTLWIKKTPTEVLTNIPANENQWIIVNVQECGYYRVNYDNTNWKLLIKHLMNKNTFNQIEARNRAQLLNDALNLARTGILDYNIALNVTRYLTHERNYVAWQSAFSSLHYIDVMLVRTGHYDKFKDYMLYLIDGLYKEIGYHEKQTDSQLTLYKRIDVLHWACSLGLQDCIRNSVMQFQNWRSLPNPDKNNPYVVIIGDLILH